MFRVLLLLVCSAALSRAQRPEFNWQCETVDGAESVDVDQAIGTWYVAKHFSTGSQVFYPLCTTFEIGRGNASHTLKTVIRFEHEGENLTFAYEFNMVTPSQLMEQSVSLVVVDQAEDGSTIAVAVCLTSEIPPHPKYLKTIIISKSNDQDLGPVLNRLHDLNIPGVQNITLNENLHCPMSAQ